MYFNCIYDFQKTLYKDPELISIQFRLVENMKAKYRILNYNFYNFNKTRFIIGIIYILIIIIYTDQYNKGKTVQPENKKQAITITYINSKDQSIPLFLIVQEKNYLVSQYTKGSLLYDQVIKSIINSQINNKTGLE